MAFDLSKNLYVQGTGAEEISLLFGHLGWPDDTYRGITYRLPTYGGTEAGFLYYHAAGHKFTAEDGTELMLLNYVGGNPAAVFAGDVAYEGSLGVNGDILTVYDVGGLRISGSNFPGSGATLTLASDNIGDSNRYDVIFARAGTKLLEYDYSELHWHFQSVDVLGVGQLGVGTTAPNSYGVHVVATGSVLGPTDNGATFPLNIQKDANVVLGIFTGATYESRIQFGDIATNTGRIARISVPVSDGDMYFETGGSLGVSSTEKVRIKSSGRLGVGTNDPSTMIGIYSDSAAKVSFHNTTTGTGSTAGLEIGYSDASGNAIFWNRYATGFIRFGTNPAAGAVERMRIDSAGLVSIGGAHGTADGQVHIVGPGGQITGTPRPALTNQTLVLEGGESINTNVSFVLGAGTSGNLQAYRANNTTAFGVIRWEESTGDFVVRTGAGAGSVTDKLRLTSADGYLGIGGAYTPTYGLELQGASGFASRAHFYCSEVAVGYGSQLVLEKAGTGWARLDFTCNGSNSLFIYTDSVNGTVRTDGVGSVITLDSQAGQVFHINHAEVGRINANGKLTIGPVSQDSYQLGVVGSSHQYISAASNAANGNAALLASGNGTGAGQLVLTGGGLTAYTTSFDVAQASTGTVTLNNRSTASIFFQVASATRAAIASGGGLYVYGSTGTNQVRLTSNNGSYYNYIWSNVSDAANYGLYVNVQGSDRFVFLNGGGFMMPEQETAPATSAGYGYQWVKNSAPSKAMFTDDTGIDVQLSMTSGTWTPTIQDASFSNAEGQTYTTQDGKYWVIGNLCFFWVDIEINSLGSLTTTDPVYLAGLPFNPTAGYNNMTCTFNHGGSLNVPAGSYAVGRIQQSTDRMIVQLWDSTSGTSSMLISELSAGGRLIGNGWYRMQ